MTKEKLSSKSLLKKRSIKKSFKKMNRTDTQGLKIKNMHYNAFIASFIRAKISSIVPVPFTATCLPFSL